MTRRTHRSSLREAYGQALVELGERNPRVVALDADHSSATGTAAFARQFPERAVNVGVADATMISIAAGLALDGRPTFVGTNAVFAMGEAYNFVRQSVCFQDVPVKIVGCPAGLSPGAEGGALESLEDLGLARGLPGMTVLVPADAPSARAATFALAERPGPAYLRLAEEPLPDVSDGAVVVGRAPERHAGSDLTIVAVGALVHRAVDVAEELARVGVSVRVLDLVSVKPCDAPALRRAARETGAILVVEEHSVETGVGALVAATVAEEYPVPVRRLGIPDLFGESGDSEALLDRYGLSRARIRDEAWELLRTRGKVT